MPITNRTTASAFSDGGQFAFAICGTDHPPLVLRAESKEEVQGWIDTVKYEVTSIGFAQFRKAESSRNLAMGRNSVQGRLLLYKELPQHFSSFLDSTSKLPNKLKIVRMKVCVGE